MFSRRSTAAGIAATLIAGLAGLGVTVATADGERPSQHAGERSNLQQMMGLRTVHSVGQAKRLASAAGIEGRTVTFVTHVIPGRNAFVDVPPADISPGDMFIQEATVLNGQRTRRLGTAILRCDINITTPTCSHAISLKGRGKLLITNPLIGGFMGAITGGTGEFMNAGGQGTWFDLGRPDFDMLFVMQLTR
jgi:hypothetical protein